MKQSWWRRFRCQIRRAAKKNGVRTLCTDCAGCIVMYYVASGVVTTACRDEDGDLTVGDYITKYGKFIVRLHKEFGI